MLHSGARGKRNIELRKLKEVEKTVSWNFGGIILALAWKLRETMNHLNTACPGPHWN
jgi:hypothetical protein